MLRHSQSQIESLFCSNTLRKTSAIISTEMLNTTLTLIHLLAEYPFTRNGPVLLVSDIHYAARPPQATLQIPVMCINDSLHSIPERLYKDDKHENIGNSRPGPLRSWKDCKDAANSRLRVQTPSDVTGISHFIRLVKVKVTFFHSSDAVRKQLIKHNLNNPVECSVHEGNFNLNQSYVMA